MRRPLKVGFSFAALVGMSALMAFAEYDTVYSPRAPLGPQYGRIMVKRSDLGITHQKGDGPAAPNKPHPIVESRTAGGGNLGGHRMSSGGGIPVASASPQVVLESRLKSLANDLR